MNDCYINNKRISLNKEIGKGGEGTIYTSDDLPGHAIKIFSKNDSQKIEKIQEMIKAEYFNINPSILFPKIILTDKNNNNIGYAMSLAKDQLPVHELYGIKSRKQLFPKADYRFLVRVAINISKTFAQIHKTACVIGDINHSGILISNDATISVIDTDSFQLKINNNLYPCVVGVPEYTPPELQAKNLRAIERTQTHDCFGLSTLIFQLLFLGRHPYSGAGIDLNLDECIKENLFAYSLKNPSSNKQPKNSPGLNFFPNLIINSFEESFSKDSYKKRTSAAEWVQRLEDLEKSLVNCKSNPVHFYPKNNIFCPWCEMENNTGIIIFIPKHTPQSNYGNIPNLEQLLKEINSYYIDDQKLFPKPINTQYTSPSISAKKSKRVQVIQGVVNKILIIIIISITLTMLITKSKIYLIPIALTLYSLYKLRDKTEIEWVDKYKQSHNLWINSLYEWRESHLNKFYVAKFNLEKAIYELHRLEIDKKRSIEQYKNNNKDEQLIEYLDKYLIKNANIDIPKSLIPSLISNGIESAADVKYNKIFAIPKFGKIRTSELVRWRAKIENQFKYDPSKKTNSSNKLWKIEHEFDEKIRLKINELKTYENTYRSVKNEILNLDKKQSLELEDFFIELHQIRYDLAFLNINCLINIQPKKYNPITNFSPPAGTSYNVSSTKDLSNKPKCPICHSTMSLKNGRYSFFWGCPRYPSCKGTRNI